MKRISLLSLTGGILLVFCFFLHHQGAPNLGAQDQEYLEMDEVDPETEELMRAKQALKELENESLTTRGQWESTKKKAKKSFTKAEAFVAGPNWEFDGFVAGGQDSRIKSMFVLNDIIYLNIGEAQGLEPGDELSIYRRGDRVRDPQTGRFIGYEVRRGAISKVTNKVDEETCAVRITKTYEGVEVGDLVRKD